MSARSINCLKAKAAQAGLPACNFHRRYTWRDDGPNRFMPDDGKLGWYCSIAGDEGETYLGPDLNSALGSLDNWSKPLAAVKATG